MGRSGHGHMIRAHRDPSIDDRPQNSFVIVRTFLNHLAISAMKGGRLRKENRVLREERDILKQPSCAAVAALLVGPETLSAATLRPPRGEWPFAFW